MTNIKSTIEFQKGQYGPIKDVFKAIYSGKGKPFRWMGEGWVGNTGYVKPTQKMETWEAVTFIVDADKSITDALVEFCKTHGIKYTTDLTDHSNQHEPLMIEKLKIAHHKQYNIDRATRFHEEMIGNTNYSQKFKDFWEQRFRTDDI